MAGLASAAPSSPAAAFGVGGDGREEWMFRCWRRLALRLRYGSSAQEDEASQSTLNVSFRAAATILGAARNGVDGRRDNGRQRLVLALGQDRRWLLASGC